MIEDSSKPEKLGDTIHHESVGMCATNTNCFKRVVPNVARHVTFGGGGMWEVGLRGVRQVLCGTRCSSNM